MLMQKEKNTVINKFHDEKKKKRFNRRNQICCFFSNIRYESIKQQKQTDFFSTRQIREFNNSHLGVCVCLFFFQT